ncbi:SAM-dependent methyltransferase [Helicobacter sp. MIT 14-3879]|uniref:SAM-dependent methyltransferase n=1 Tax=Helicobacter sp. MIT 14-3879 TaxID=2040649 RepID=UPI000E1E5CA2|nr:SAM-dependent methyltransferase [Helicobacter sp. MIT 14-3879]RDU60580.1 hemolysin [Helicobacter sp. MIT 14-3879]
MRLDQYIAAIYHCSRQKANDMIKQHCVLVNNQRISKPAYRITQDDIIVLTKEVFIANTLYCSRGAFKLQRFLENTLCKGQIIKRDNQTQSYTHTKDSMQEEITAIKQHIHALIARHVLLDVGASSGGFTQVLLAKGARFVIAQDIGSLQLDKNLRKNKKVFSLENLDIRDFSNHQRFWLESLLLDSLRRESKVSCALKLSRFQSLQSVYWIHKKSCPNILDSILHNNKAEQHYTTKPFRMLTCDVSFVSLSKILHSLRSFSNHLLLLFKPQFEVGLYAKRNKKGVVTDIKAIEQSLLSILRLLEDCNVKLIYIEKSQVKGREGNEEFFIFCQF